MTINFSYLQVAVCLYMLFRIYSTMDFTLRFQRRQGTRLLYKWRVWLNMDRFGQIRFFLGVAAILAILWCLLAIIGQGHFDFFTFGKYPTTQPFGAR